ncbi:MAG: hypothetical protein CL521_03665 [Actinobacteria bacterium]|nr:hypothetical protein [Actinomycetota bacterium]
MSSLLLEPFNYSYMANAIWVSGLVGATCAFLSAYLMLKGWSLMGDALAHSIVPGVALAYLLNLPYAIGAFFSGLLAALSMHIVKQKTQLREDAVIGLIFTTFFALGLLLISIKPTAINIQGIILGNILAISPIDRLQVIIISLISCLCLLINWKAFMLVFFDDAHAKSIGIRANALKVLFFTLLSAATVAALQTVGACLVIALLVTPGSTAYLYTDRFGILIIISVLIGTLTCVLGTYLSYFLDANPGGLIVCLQTSLFLLSLILAPKHGLLVNKRSQKKLRTI